MKILSTITLFLLVSFQLFAQSPADSVTIVFRAYETSSAVMCVPGEFNGWGPNASGVIQPNAVSRMYDYNSDLGAWTKSYTFKINDPNDNSRTLADTIYQYKFNKSGNVWYADPLNREQNAGDNSNSVLRLSKLFWFEYNQVLTGNNISRITASVIRANSDTITAIYLSTGTQQGSTLTTVDLTANYNPATRIVDAILATQIPKANYIRLVAYNNHGDSTVFSKGGYVWTYRAMPSYVKNGVTLPSVSSNDSTSFRLRVPNKEYVLVRIAPLGSPVATANPIVLNHHTDSYNWWVNVKLAPGTYEYQFEIENGKMIHDPWGREIGDNGTRFTIGAAGLTADDYVWQNTGYARPPLNKLIIYEMNMMEFAGGYFNLSNPNQTRWSHLRSLLPYLDSLGINAIELMPVTDFGNIGPSGFSWGYDVNSYFALEPTFGTPRDFKEFVDSAHGRGIAVIMDMVLNHLNETSALWQMLPDEAQNPYFKSCSEIKPNEDGLCFFKDMDYWTPIGSINYSEELAQTALKMWVDSYHIDGFRYDYTQGIGWNKNDTSKGVLGFANVIAKTYNNSIYQIAEHLPESPALIYYSGMTSSWHGDFRGKLFGEAAGTVTTLTDMENIVLGLGITGSNDTPYTPSAYASRIEPVNDCSNHDEQTLLYEMIKWHSIDTATAYQRDKLYSTFMFTSLGIPMLWEGNEMGEIRGYTSNDNKLSYRPVQWNYLTSPRGQSQFKHYRTLIMQRRYNPALYNGTLVKQYRYDASRVLVWGFKDSVSGNMIEVVANMGASSKTVTNVPWLAAGTWYDVFDQSTFEAGSTTLASFTIPGYTARVFSNKRDSDIGIPLGVDDGTGIDVPSKFLLAQNYPNPFNPSTTIHFELPKQSRVTLKIFDIMGREIATLVDQERHAGMYDIQWNAANSASGIYFYRLTTDAGTITKKLMLVR